MERKGMDDKYKWDLTTIYKKHDDFYVDIKMLKKQLEELKTFEGKLDKKDSIASYLKLKQQFSLRSTKAWCYAIMAKDIAMDEAKPIEDMGAIDALETKAGQQLAFATVEMSGLDDAFLTDLSKDPELRDFDRYFQEILREKKHILSKGEEKLLAGFAGVSDYQGLYDTYTTNMLKFEPVRAKDGKMLELTRSNYSQFMLNLDRDIRKQAYENFGATYKEHNIVLSEFYIAKLKSTKLFSSARKFESSLKQSLYGDELDESVYYNLLESVEQAKDIAEKMTEIRKKKLGLDEIMPYDRALPLDGVPMGLDFSFDYAVDCTKRAVAHINDECVRVVDDLVKNRHFDVFPSKNKTDGGYNCSFGIGTSYVLLNYVDVHSWFSAVAHECGHALHAHYTEKSQPWDKTNPGIFLCEIASTVNEILLIHELIKNAKTPEEKKYYMYERVSDAWSTMSTGPAFAKFEDEAHKLVQNDAPISYEVLNKCYSDIFSKYFAGTKLGEYTKYMWSTIPHFYRPFYFFKYATGMVSAIVIADKILHEEGYSKKYIEFLSAGGSLPSLDILKNAGVDLTDIGTYKKSINTIRTWVDEYSKL